jgi:hypothetical protein
VDGSYVLSKGKIHKVKLFHSSLHVAIQLWYVIAFHVAGASFWHGGPEITFDGPVWEAQGDGLFQVRYNVQLE